MRPQNWHSAIKFGDLVNQRTKDYIFDLEKFLSFEGKTGTYLLYTVTRICSVLKKVGTAPMPAPTRFYSDTERMLITQLLLSGDVFCRLQSAKGRPTRLRGMPIKSPLYFRVFITIATCSVSRICKNVGIGLP